MQYTVSLCVEGLSKLREQRNGGSISWFSPGKRRNYSTSDFLKRDSHGENKLVWRRQQTRVGGLTVACQIAQFLLL